MQFKNFEKMNQREDTESKSGEATASLTSKEEDLDFKTAARRKYEDTQQNGKHGNRYGNRPPK